MTLLKVLLIVLASAVSGWGKTRIEAVYLYDDVTVAISSDTATWIVAKGSQTYTLDEFVKSGKFCEWRRRHEWAVEDNAPPLHYAVMWYACDGRPLTSGWKCVYCDRCRQKVKSQKEVEEWEP